MSSTWSVRSLGEVCKVVGGGTPSKDRQDFYKGDIPWATVRDMRNEMLSETEFSITKDAVQMSATNIVPAKNVIIATRVGLGKVCYLERDTAINQDLRGVIPSSESGLSARFLFWWFKSVSHLIEQEGTGATVQGVKLPFIKSLPIPVPPLPEQKRIVAILDEAFDGIDAAIANAEKNLANARELFDSYLNSAFIQRGQSWIVKKLKDTVEITCSLSYGIVQPGGDVNDGLPIVRPTDLQSKIIGLSGLKRIGPALADGYKRTKLHGGELLLCVRGGTGAVSIAAKELAGSNVTRGIVPIRFNASIVLQEFGYFAFISKGVQDQIRAATYGAALMQINIRDLRNLSLVLPPLVVQRDLLGKFGDLSAKVERLELIYKQKLASLGELKQAILHKAFTGELTAQPEKAVKEAAE